LKQLQFYEVNEYMATSSRLFALFPERSEDESTILAREIFDVINNLGAATPRRLQKEFSGYTNGEINYALGRLISAKLITPRSLEAHDLD